MNMDPIVKLWRTLLCFADRSKDHWKSDIEMSLSWVLWNRIDVALFLMGWGSVSLSI